MMNVKTLVLLTLSAVFSLTQRSFAQQTASNAMMKAMQAGMTKMMGAKMSGDPDHDFAMMLKAHHQSAVDMSDIEIKQGKNPQVVALARKIKASNQQDIQKLDQFLSSHKPQSTASKLGKKGMEIMHSGSHSMNGNVDHDYASMMAQHHQQGVDMALAYLKEGKTPTMKAMANKVIKEQSKEGADLKSLQTKVAAR